MTIGDDESPESSLLSTSEELRRGSDPLREFIARQVGGLDKLKVLADNPNVANVVNATKSTGSCGSCHLGEAAGKAGTVLNFNVGGEGRGYTDENGRFIIRRRPQQNLIPRASAFLTTVRLFEGDTGVDSLPTLTDIYNLGGALEVATPARQKSDPLADALIATGRLDQVDSVGRQSPSMVGFAFNNRLLFGGFAGESNALPGGLNPLNDPAQENLTLLLPPFGPSGRTAAASRTRSRTSTTCRPDGCSRTTSEKSGWPASAWSRQIRTATPRTKPGSCCSSTGATAPRPSSSCSNHKTSQDPRWHESGSHSAYPSVCTENGSPTALRRTACTNFQARSRRWLRSPETTLR